MVPMWEFLLSFVPLSSAKERAWLTWISFSLCISQCFGHCSNKIVTRAHVWFLKFREPLVANTFVQLNLTFIAWKKRTSCFIAQWRGPNCNQLYKVSLQSNVPCCLTKRLKLLVCRWSFVNVQSRQKEIRGLWNTSSSWENMWRDAVATQDCEVQ